MAAEGLHAPPVMALVEVPDPATPLTEEAQLDAASGEWSCCLYTLSTGLWLSHTALVQTAAWTLMKSWGSPREARAAARERRQATCCPASRQTRLRRCARRQQQHSCSTAALTTYQGSQVTKSARKAAKKRKKAEEEQRAAELALRAVRRHRKKLRQRGHVVRQLARLQRCCALWLTSRLCRSCQRRGRTQNMTLEKRPLPDSPPGAKQAVHTQLVLSLDATSLPCRGVVRLFNAVSTAQQRRREGAQPHHRSKVISSFSLL